MTIFEKDSKDLSLKDINNGEESLEHSQTSWILYSGGFIGENIVFPEEDYYKFDIFARGTQEQGEWVRLALKINDQLALPRIISGEETLKYSFIEKIGAGRQKISFHFEYDRQVDEVKLQSGNADITPMENTYITGGFGLYTGKLTVTKFSSGIIRRVPGGDYKTIQSAVDASSPGDKVVVYPGRYNEQIVMREGVILVSDSINRGNEFIDVSIDDNIPAAEEIGIIQKKALRRTLRTVIDGAGFPDHTDAAPMVDFPGGISETTILDGFSITNMPQVNHTLPGHAHTISCRGSSPCVFNNFVYINGSAGIGSHALFKDEKNENLEIDQRNFQYDNVEHLASPIIKNNIFFRNSGAGIGNNHYSFATVFYNECAGNYSTEDHDAPGIGIQHGARPIVEANLLHHNDWSGVGCRKGVDLGMSGFHINLPTYPVIRKNICHNNGLSTIEGNNRNIDHGAGIGIDGAGSENYRVVVEQNICYENRMAGIGVRNDSQIIIRNNNSYRNKMAGIGINTRTSFVLLKENIVCQNDWTGIGCMDGASPIIFNNQIYSNSLSGIGLDGAGQVKIIFNRIYKNQLGGIGITKNSRVKLIRGNLIFENETVGIGIRNSMKIKEIRDNKIFANRRPGIALLPDSAVEEINNNIIDNNGLSGAPNVVIQNTVVFAKTTKLINNTITNNYYVNIRIDKSNVLLENNVISNSKNVGMTITGESEVKVNRNVIHHNDGPGIVTNGAKLEIYHTTFYKNTRQTGGAVVANNADITLKNNIFSKNKIGLGGSFKSIDMDHNCFWESFVPPLYNIGFNSIEEDPVFVDENGNDFRLVRGSPCIDEGEKISGINDNFQGEGPDIGTHEWDGTT